MEKIDLEKEFKLAQILADIQYVLVLDDIWTKSLNGSIPIIAKDIKLLEIYTNEMDIILKRLQDSVASVDHLMDNDLPIVIEEVARNTYVSAESRERALKAFNSMARGFVATNHSDLIKQNLIMLIPQERKQLIDKIEIIREGKHTPGDLSRGGRCALGFVGVAAGAYLGAWPLAASGIMMVGANCGPE